MNIKQIIQGIFDAEYALLLFCSLSVYFSRDMDNLLMWIFTKEVISYLPKKFQEEKLKFDQVE